MSDNTFQTIPTYPHAVAPECDCEIGAVCPHWACCYADEAVPENVRSELVAPATPDVTAAELEGAIDMIIEGMPVPADKMFVGDDGKPEALKVKFNDMAELRNFFHAALTIGITLGRRTP